MAGVTDDVNLDIPKGAPLTKEKGTTGLQLPRLQNVSGTMKLVPTWISHSPGDVMQFIEEQSTRYGKYIPEIWDCEDWAYLAAADVRRKFSGQPVGILLGKGKFGPNIEGNDHAINILWFAKRDADGKEVWYPRYYDATWKREITDMAGGDPPFDTEIVIPCPIGGSDNSKDYKELPPYENNPPFLKTATFALDRTDYDFSTINDVKRMLTEWNNISYGTASQVDSRLFTQTDQAFYYFAHIRRWHANIRSPSPKGTLPVGLVVGKIVSSGNDYAALILWNSENKDDYIYWDIYVGEVIDPILKKVDPIKPRVILV